MSTGADTAGLEATIAAYVAATATRDRTAMAGLFHERAVMTGQRGCATPELSGPGRFVEALGGFGAADVAGYRAAIAGLEVRGDIGWAHLVEEGLAGARFDTHFHLIRGPDGWRIVSKLFVRHQN